MAPTDANYYGFASACSNSLEDALAKDYDTVMVLEDDIDVRFLRPDLLGGFNRPCGCPSLATDMW